MSKKFLLILFLGCFFPRNDYAEKHHQYAPNITVVFIIDQFGYSYLTKYGAYLRHGIKDLCKMGIVYHNALYPHAMPTTPTGHAAIATGSYANVHGFNSYGFVDSNNKFIEITEDSDPNTAVFKEDGSCYDVGRSPRYLMTDTVADRFILASRCSAKPRHHEAAAFSLKPRASIPLAGNMGKAFWLDEATATITTSKFYFDKFPEWLRKFNAKNKIKNNTTLIWKPFYCSQASAYKYPEAFNYEFSNIKPEKKSTTKKILIDYSAQNPSNVFARSPFASNLLFSAAKAYIRKKRDKRLLIYISLSNFDFSGHMLGPDNFDQIDLLYHLDSQIGQFMRFIDSLFSLKRALFVFTADHGISQIPEIQKKQGFKFAERIDANVLIENINTQVEKEFGYKNIIHHFESPQLYLDRKVLDKISEVKKSLLYQKIKDVLFSYECILDVWSELDFEKGSYYGQKNQEYRDLFMKQYVRGRSGHVMFLTYPNRMVTTYPTGTGHYSPYRDNIHVPLIIYQRSKFEKKEICEPVSLLSLATTQSFLMGILPPSSATPAHLPGIKLFKVLREPY